MAVCLLFFKKQLRRENVKKRKNCSQAALLWLLTELQCWEVAAVPKHQPPSSCHAFFSLYL